MSMGTPTRGPEVRADAVGQRRCAAVPGASIAAVVALVAVLAWSDWPALRAMATRWGADPRYSHGVLVAPFAAYLLWLRRGLCPGAGRRPGAWGVLPIVAGAALQVLGARIFFGWFEGAALILGLAGIAALWGGLPALRWAGPSLAFLIFMIPLPYRLEVALGEPLQRLGTLASTYALQTLGLPAIAEGNIIRLDDKASIAVVEACNGLGMLAAFACYATGAALVMRGRDPIIRVLILASAAPLALVANVARITVTGVAHATLGGGAADLVFHDLAGWLMMPLALALLWAELALIGMILVEGDVPAPVAAPGTFDFGRARRTRADDPIAYRSPSQSRRTAP